MKYSLRIYLPFKDARHSSSYTIILCPYHRTAVSSGAEIRLRSLFESIFPLRAFPITTVCPTETVTLWGTAVST